MVTRAGAPAGHRIAAALAAAVISVRLAAQDAAVTAPFVTTPEEVVDRMLRIAGTGPQDTVLDLGCGDGRIVIAAAKNFGARGIGVDIDARLVALSRENALRAGVAQRTEFTVGDALRTELARASVVTVYLLPFLIDQLQPKFLAELKPGARVVTHAFVMKGWKPDRSETVTIVQPHGSRDSRGERSEIHLWVVPAQARGQWQAGGWRLRISQNFQEIEIEGEADGRAIDVKHARLEGSAVSFAGDGFSFRGRVLEDRITGELTRTGVAAPLEFTRR